MFLMMFFTRLFFCEHIIDLLSRGIIGPYVVARNHLSSPRFPPLTFIAHLVLLMIGNKNKIYVEQKFKREHPITE